MTCWNTVSLDTRLSDRTCARLGELGDQHPEGAVVEPVWERLPRGREVGVTQSSSAHTARCEGGEAAGVARVIAPSIRGQVYKLARPGVRSGAAAIGCFRSAPAKVNLALINGRFLDLTRMGGFIDLTPVKVSRRPEKVARRTADCPATRTRRPAPAADALSTLGRARG